MTPKAPLPLYCVRKVTGLQPDVTEFVTVANQASHGLQLQSMWRIPTAAVS